MLKSLSPLVALRLTGLVTMLNVATATGFSLASIIATRNEAHAGQVGANTSLVLALYAASRTVALLVVTLVVIYKRDRSLLLLMCALTGLIQVLDAGVGWVQGDVWKIIGPLAIATLQAAALASLSNAEG